MNTIGLQFQIEDSNTGRVCLGYDGLVFDLVKKNIMAGSEVPKVERGKLDSVVYKAIIANDAKLIAFAANDTVEWHHKKVHLKFLRLGLGFFAGKFGNQLKTLFLSAAIDGLELFLRKHPHQHIAIVEFPFCTPTKDEIQRVESISKLYGIEFKFTQDDVLKFTASSADDYMLVVTNCGDNHVVLGNEMNYGSVDGMIGENIKSKGNIFNPNLNKLISYKYVDVNE